MHQSMTDRLTFLAANRLRQEGVSLAGKTVLCALSGGRDSVVLLHILRHLSVQQGFAVCAAHFNHHLRETAGRDEAFARTHCESLGIPITVGSGDVAAFARREGKSIEDAARTLRYEFLQRTADEIGADFIATGHHRGDNAETVLFHLLRGSGLKGLGGIAFLRGNILRPLLDADRGEIDACILENGLSYVEDETNSDTAYTRNRIRHELLPLLEELSPGSTGRIADTAARLRCDETHLQQQADALLGDERTSLSFPLLKAQSAAIAARMIRSAAREIGAELTGAQTDALLQLRRGACLSLGGGARAAREGEFLRFYHLPPFPDPLVLSPGVQHWGTWRVTVAFTDTPPASDDRTVVLRGDLAPVTIAVWDGTGRLSVETGKRTVKRLFADRGIPASHREGAPAIYAGDTLAAVFGAGTDLTLQGSGSEGKLVITIDSENQA